MRYILASILLVLVIAIAGLIIEYRVQQEAITFLIEENGKLQESIRILWQQNPGGFRLPLMYEEKEIHT